MKLSTALFIAKRFLISRQKKTALSVISWISIIGMVVSSAAMIILLSAFNGIELLIDGMYTEFDQEIIINPKFNNKADAVEFEAILKKLKKIPEVGSSSFYIQERVILRKKKKWSNAELWAVQSDFLSMANICKSQHLYNGKCMKGELGSMIGIGLANKLGLKSMQSEPEQVILYIPRQDRKIRIGKNPFFQEIINVDGAIDYNQEINDQVLLVDLDFALGYFDNKVSGLLVSTNKSSREFIKNKLNQTFGKKFNIQTNLEKNELVFKTSRSEKLIVVVILIFVFVLSLFNLTASLTMTFLEKKPHFKTLISVGISTKGLKTIFVALGAMVVFLGVGIGVIVGTLIVGLQQYFELLKIPGNLKVFPTHFDFPQIGLVSLLLLALGFVVSWLTTSYLIQSTIKGNFLLQSE